jgi:ER membrane protein SH3
MSVAIPSLRTIATPAEGDTRDDRIEAMRVLSAGNTIIIVILAGVLLLQVSLNRMDDRIILLFLQAGEEYARRAEAKELAKIIEAEKKAASAPQDKKDQ